VASHVRASPPHLRRTVEHDPVSCIIAGQFPELPACVSPASSVARGRVYFQVEGQNCREIASALDGFDELNVKVDAMCSDLAEQITKLQV
jgi:hypothetical protein